MDITPSRWQVRQGDAAEIARQLPAQVGQEDTPEAYCARLVEIFREARRVLRDDGTLWVNIGDSYAGGGGLSAPSGIKRKDLIGIPWMLATALRADGWYLRCDIIWHKTNATPESAVDRPGRSHEYIFLFSKRPHYYYDKEAVREPNQGTPPGGRKAAILVNRSSVTGRGGRLISSVNHKQGKWAQSVEAHGGFVAWNPRGRNRRSVWTLASSSFKASSVGITDVDHFAVFPPDLVRPCIRASTSAGGCCPACLAPYTRFVADYEDTEDTWTPSCDCPPAQAIPCTVWDTFTGSGTTGVASVEEGRSFIGSELNPDYVRLAEARIGAAKKNSIDVLKASPIATSL
jgi:DNA modification methylase